MKSNSMAKVLSFVVLLCTTVSANADWRGNFFLGMETAYAARDGKAVITAVESFPPNQAASFNRSSSDSGYFWGLVGGYQVRCRNVLYGIDAKVTWQDFNNRRGFHFFDGNMDHYSNFLEYERREVWSLSGRAGYQVNPWALVYFRLGVESADETVIFQANNVTQSNFLELKGVRSDYRMLSGLGVEIPLWKQVTARLEYNYSGIGKGTSATGIMPVSLEVVSVESEVRQHTLLLDFIWNFRPLA